MTKEQINSRAREIAINIVKASLKGDVIDSNEITNAITKLAEDASNSASAERENKICTWLTCNAEKYVDIMVETDVDGNPIDNPKAVISTGCMIADLVKA